MMSKQFPADTIAYRHRSLQQLFQVFMLSTVILLIGAGAALLWETQHIGKASMPVHAVGDVGVSGSPTIAAVTVNAIFARLGSPMVGTGKLVEQVSRQTSIDDAFALAVWWTETNDGAAGVGLADRNPGSVRGSVGYPSAFDGYTIYPSYTAAITYWFNLLRNGYVNRGLSTVYTIARPYVGTTSYPLWAGKVIALMFNYRAIAPPPPVSTSTPRPKPTIDPNIGAANLVSQYKQHKLMQLRQSLSAASSTSLPGQGRAQEMSQQYYTGTSQADIPRTLARTTEVAIVLFGLLAALAIALYALRVPARGYLDGEVPRTSLPTQAFPTIDEGFTPKTDELPVLPTQLPVTSERSRVTDALPRRVLSLPSHTDTRTPVTAGAGVGTRSAGLLSRYRESQQ